MYEFQHEINKKVYAEKEKLLWGIMAQVLGREPTTEDAPQFQFLQDNRQPQKEFIGHKEKGLLGEIVFSSRYDEQAQNIVFSFTFLPKNRFDL